MYRFNFEKLEIWKEAIELSQKIYVLTKSWPLEEKYGLTNQIRRASTSISTNIAEGSTRSSSKERLRYIQIAFGSLMEVLSLLLLANKLGFINNERRQELRKEIEKSARMINAYKNAIK